MTLRFRDYVPGWARRVVANMLEFSSPSNDAVEHNWLRLPGDLSGKEVCLFACYARDGRLPRHSRYHAEAWAKAGFAVILAINTDDMGEFPPNDLPDFATGVLVRNNRGYDFGAWAQALRTAPRIGEAAMIAITNDSVFGPFNTFQAMLERARQLDCDVVGSTESREFGRHFQSFLLFFKSAALRSGAFWTFWSMVRAGGRTIAIYRYETLLLRQLEYAGLRCCALYPAVDSRNPTLTRWRGLVDDGFPFVKTVLIRQNPFRADISDWREVMDTHGYDHRIALGQSDVTAVSPETPATGSP